MTEQDFFKRIADEESIRVEQVQATVALLDDENTVPFIARYRKEVTGGLDEIKIIAIQDRMRYLRLLEERKQTVLKSIEEQGKLTDELREKISGAMKLQEVEDLYLPYKPKKRTRATVAKEKGLEPLAQRMWGQQDITGEIEQIAAEYVSEEKGVASAQEALSGACDIVAEWVSDDAETRKLVREMTWEHGTLRSEARDPENLDVYEMYKDYRDPLKKVVPHRTLAINRGEREGFLKVAVEAPVPEILADMEKRFLTNPACIFTDHNRSAIKDSYDRLISPAIERELRNQLSEVADEHAITIFATNLRNLLMQPPTQGNVIMGIDPGFRTGCKVAVIDKTGKYLEGDTIYPHEPQKRWDYAKQQLLAHVRKHNVTIIAIGNGTASRETEQLVAELIKEAAGGENPVDLRYTIVNEAGASVYSASELARQEFPDLEAAQRGNVSIARRLLDPLSELVKIDPKSIGVGLYQHDVNQSRLAESLDRVVESCVNAVGVDLNTASSALLRYVAGVTRSVAENIVAYRNQQGGFTSRQELLEVKGIGPKAFTQCAGFMRIPNADTFFDSTAVHPESYSAAERFLTILELTPEMVRTQRQLFNAKIKTLGRSLTEIAAECGVGLPTLEDIIAAMEKPDRDPRDEAPKPIFRQDVLKMEDLKEGMILKGTVRNVVDFGAFVDIGVKQDGLVHLSAMSHKYIKSPLEVVAVGDVIDVRVLRVDTEKGRIGLSMLLEGERRPPEKPKPPAKAAGEHDGRERRHQR
ncbi:RNA-binding transcriptional accessory protein, partial [candidate division KSB1 bacterium]|nr:RNA-binding transcriptional accessory protein [candidate division KSB1 bacterium]